MHGGGSSQPPSIHIHTHINVHSFLHESRRQSTQAFTGSLARTHTAGLPAKPALCFSVTIFDKRFARGFDIGTIDASNPTMKP